LRETHDIIGEKTGYKWIGFGVMNVLHERPLSSFVSLTEHVYTGCKPIVIRGENIAKSNQFVLIE
jgi:hypothetical protein